METITFAIGMVVGLLLAERRNRRAEDTPATESFDKEYERQLKQLRALEQYNGMPQEDTYG